MRQPGSRTKDISGQVFGSLTAIKPVGKDKSNNTVWQFQCLCGNLHECRGSHAASAAKQCSDPLVPSCGCVRMPHGLCKHPLYNVWNSMINRCHNPADKNYPNYGGKGITVCPSWRGDVNSFFTWALANGWKKGLQLDKDILSALQNITRVYSPSTCQFIAQLENSKYSSRRENYKSNLKIKINPETAAEIRRLHIKDGLSMRLLAEMYDITQPGIRYVIASGDLTL